MARDGTVTVKITGDSKGLKNALDDSDGHLNKFGGKMGGVAAGVGKAFLGMGTAAGAFGVLSVKAFAEAEEVAAQTGAVLKSTGGIANVTAKDVDTLSGSLSKMSGVDDEAIASGQNLLLTFTKVRNEVGEGNNIFDQATKATLDMSVAMGTDMKSAALLMGKALNDPTKGMTALTRSGVSFTKAQKDQVKAMVEAGDEMGAQKLILKELETQFGGSAEAAGGTFAGQLNKLKVQAGNFMEEVGAKIVPVLLDLATWLGTNVPIAVETLRPHIEHAISIFKDVYQAVADFVDRLRSGGGEVTEAGDKIGGVFTDLKDIVKPAFEAIKAIITQAVEVISGLWDRFGRHLLGHLETSFNAIMQAVRGALDVIKGIFNVFAAIFTGDWGRLWDGLTQIFAGLWNVFLGIFKNALNIVSTIIGAAMAGISAAWSAIWNGIKTLFSDLWAGIRTGIVNAVDGIVNFFRDLPGRMARAGAGVWDWLFDAMKDVWERIKRFWNSLPAVTINVPDILPGPDEYRIGFPRFHQGGIVPGRPGSEVLGLLQAGERVIPRGGTGGAAGGVVYLTVNVSTLDPAGAGPVVIDAIKEYERRNGTNWRVA